MMPWFKLVKVFFSVDFVVLDMGPNHASKQIPFSLRCPFLATANIIINYRPGVMDVSVMNMRVKALHLQGFLLTYV